MSSYSERKYSIMQVQITFHNSITWTNDYGIASMESVGIVCSPFDKPIIAEWISNECKNSFYMVIESDSTEWNASSIRNARM